MLTDLNLSPEYRSDDGLSIIEDFYTSCLQESTIYRRAVGYFTSHGIALAARGVNSLISNGGRMYLVASPHLSEQDRQAIELGYKSRDQVCSDSVVEALDKIEHEEDQNRLSYLSQLIADGNLEIQLAIPVDKNGRIKHGIYHEKIGIFSDSNDNEVAFTGSVNETHGGLVDNFESIDVFWSWEDLHKRTKRKRENFDRLWSNNTSGLDVIDFPDAAKRKLIQIRSTTRPKGTEDSDSSSSENARKWRHQDEAIEEFLKKERGVLEMATGTGKTRTALRICESLIKTGDIDSIIISTDGNDLLDQWYAELLQYITKFKTSFSIARNYRIFHDNDRYLLNPEQSILLCSRPTLAPVLRGLSKTQLKTTILIHDEVHKLGSDGNRRSLSGLSDSIRYRLGLSATSEREYDKEGTLFITEHIGPIIFPFELSDAIRRGILSPLNYFPLEYEPNSEDRKNIKKVYSKIAARKNEGNPMTKEEIWIELSKVYKLSRAKIPVFQDFIASKPELLTRCLIFVEQTWYGEEVLDCVHEHRDDFHTYFEGDDPDVLKRFGAGEIECLITCHRLSEGIDIQSISTVVLFSSSRAKLETIQRIGRCLRTNPNDPNKRANVIDFIRVEDRDDEEEQLSADAERKQWLIELSKLECEE